MSIQAANEVLRSFAKGEISFEFGRPVVSWKCGSREYRRRWQRRRGQDFYATWSNSWCGGGTSMTALSQLIRWLQGKPVLPLSTWKYWASETCKLLPMEAVETLREAGYPERVDCVLCGCVITGGIDWWNLDNVSGPCCGMGSGCQQQRQEPTE